MRKLLHAASLVGVSALLLPCGCVSRQTGQNELFWVDVDDRLVRPGAYSTTKKAVDQIWERKSLTGTWGDYVRYNDDVLTVAVDQVYLDSLPSPAVGPRDVVLFAEVWENAAEGFKAQSLNQIVFIALNQQVPGRLNFTGNLAYGPTRFKGHPLKIKFTLMLVQSGDTQTILPAFSGRATSRSPLDVLNSLKSVADLAGPQAQLASEAVTVARELLRAQPDIAVFDFEATFYSVAPEGLTATILSQTATGDQPIMLPKSRFETIKKQLADLRDAKRVSLDSLSDSIDVVRKATTPIQTSSALGGPATAPSTLPTSTPSRQEARLAKMEVQLAQFRQQAADTARDIESLRNRTLEALNLRMKTHTDSSPKIREIQNVINKLDKLVAVTSIDDTSIVKAGKVPIEQLSGDQLVLWQNVISDVGTVAIADSDSGIRKAIDDLRQKVRAAIENAKETQKALHDIGGAGVPGDDIEKLGDLKGRIVKLKSVAEASQRTDLFQGLQRNEFALNEATSKLAAEVVTFRSSLQAERGRLDKVVPQSSIQTLQEATVKLEVGSLASQTIVDELSSVLDKIGAIIESLDDLTRAAIKQETDALRDRVAKVNAANVQLASDASAVAYLVVEGDPLSQVSTTWTIRKDGNWKIDRTWLRWGRYVLLETLPYGKPRPEPHVDDSGNLYLSGGWVERKRTDALIRENRNYLGFSILPYQPAQDDEVLLKATADSADLMKAIRGSSTTDLVTAVDSFKTEVLYSRAERQLDHAAQKIVSQLPVTNATDLGWQNILDHQLDGVATKIKADISGSLGNKAEEFAKRIDALTGQISARWKDKILSSTSSQK